MHIFHHILELREYIRGRRSACPGATVGFVPTMGFLHEGHESLLQTSAAQCDFTILSIFVNPLQFGPNEDFEAYPRDEARDLAVARAAGADAVFFPRVDEMYPKPTKTIVSVRSVTERLCGASRPGHFDGVSTVVTKLFNIVQPDFAYFGLKDAQQVAVIEQMTADLNLPVTIVPCPIIRESDGLAKSSRNVYLSADERRQALVLSQSLAAAQRFAERSGKDATAEAMRQEIVDHICTSPLADIDYVDVLSYPELEPIDKLGDAGRVIVALAVRFGKTRLIDNHIFSWGSN